MTSLALAKLQAQQGKLRELQEAKKNRFQSPTTHYFYGENITFKDNDKDKRKGVIRGYFFDNDVKKYIEVSINPADAEKNHANRTGEKTGGVIDATMQKLYFPYTDKNGKELKSRYLANNQFFDSNLAQDSKDLFGKDLNDLHLIVRAENCKYISTRKALIDGEMQDITMYETSWVKFVPLGSEYVDNVFFNALFSLQKKAVWVQDGDKAIPVLSYISGINVFAPYQDSKRKYITSFADKDGVKQIFDLFDAQQAYREHFAKFEENPRYDDIRESSDNKAINYLYNPYFVMGLTIPMKDMSKVPDTWKNKPTRELVHIYTPTGNSVFALSKTVSGQMVENDDGELNFVEDTYTTESGEVRTSYVTLTSEDVEVMMDFYKEDVLNPDSDTHKKIAEEFPDLDFESLSDDDFFIIGIKNFNVSKSKDLSKMVQTRFQPILDDENSTKDDQAQTWAETVEDLMRNYRAEDSLKYIRDRVGFHKMNGELYDEKGSFWLPYPLKLASKAHTTSGNDDDFFVGFLHGVSGSVVGGSLNLYENMVRAYPSVRQYAIDGNPRHILSSMFAPNAAEDEAPIFVREKFFIPLAWNQNHEKVDTANQDENDYSDAEDDTHEQAEKTNTSNTSNLNQQIAALNAAKAKEQKPAVETPVAQDDIPSDDIPF